MKIAVLTSGILTVPAVQGGAVENLIDFYLEYNNQHRLHDITVYSVWHPDVSRHPALLADCNHYHHIDTSSIWAKVRRKVYGLLHRHEYYNCYIEYFFERAWQDIKKNHYDCIILENRPGYAYKISQRGFSNLILHLHNDLFNSETPHAGELIKEFKKVITVSDYIRQRVASIQNATDKTVTVYNGINLKHFSRHKSPTLTRQDLGFSDSDFVIVFSGRINKDKGILQLIEAMLLLDDISNLKLMIIGSTFFANAVNEDSFVQKLKEEARPIKERIKFTGFVNYNMIPEYLQLADVAVIPSVWAEPFGLTVIEAQSMGLPTIVSQQGGIPEIVSPNSAIIVPTDSLYERRLADAIRQLYHSPQQCADMATAALQNAINYDKDRYAREFFNAIEPIS